MVDGRVSRRGDDRRRRVLRNHRHVALFMPLVTWLGMASMPTTLWNARVGSLADFLLSRSTMVEGAIFIVAFLVSRVLADLSVELTAVARGVEPGDLEHGRGASWFLFGLTGADPWYVVWFQTAGWWAVVLLVPVTGLLFAGLPDEWGLTSEESVRLYLALSVLVGLAWAWPVRLLFSGRRGHEPRAAGLRAQ